METIVSALIAAAASMAVCILNNRKERERIEAETARERERTERMQQESMALIQYKLDELTKHVEKHNQVIERTFNLEAKAELFEEKIKVANHRLDDLERK